MRRTGPPGQRPLRGRTDDARDIFRGPERITRVDALGTVRQIKIIAGMQASRVLRARARRPPRRFRGRRSIQPPRGRPSANGVQRRDRRLPDGARSGSLFASTGVGTQIRYILQSAVCEVSAVAAKLPDAIASANNRSTTSSRIWHCPFCSNSTVVVFESSPITG